MLQGNFAVGFVVGHKKAKNVGSSSTVKMNNVEVGTLYVTTYSQLVDTAEARMFGLRQVLAERYDDVPGMELYKQATLIM